MKPSAAALVPAAPLLLPALTGDAAVAADARAAALACIGDVIATGAEVIVLAAQGNPARVWPSDSPLRLDRIGGRGLRDGDAEPLPVPLAIGASLLRDAGWSGDVRYLTVDESGAAPDLDLPARSGLVALGNGSARCTDKAPGSLHPDAAEFNAALLRYVTDADARADACIDQAAAAEQWSDVAGPAALLATALPDDTKAHVRFAEVVNGVYYVCASFV